ncbi:hypothetical protein TELCIR_07008 [Teladorsagia circumcincta]|uniref:Uncharacterized protein n=1 Tax=Teladorsagia circumcincta TaxID=45464 RepID=A0A2G9ULG8_TELCI|nr:hypothetical protein TELCIR_07008 [Teladorsagia circumcincta]
MLLDLENLDLTKHATLRLLLITVIHPCASVFSPSFNEFLFTNYGKEFADRMLRIDIGLHGSFGGGDTRLVRPVRSGHSYKQWQRTPENV